MWPTDDTLPAEGMDGLKVTHKRLHTALDDITKASEKEIKFVHFTASLTYVLIHFAIFFIYRAIDEALEQLGVLIALRKAPEVATPGNDA